MGVPVLLLVFNRPEQTARVVDAIKDWDISRLYVAADGPRVDRSSDVALCEETRAVVLEHLGHLRIETLFRDRNLGCGHAVSSAIDWFFDNEEAGIILEDDCVPDPSFLPYCRELLDRYRDNPKVMMISGNNFLYEHQMGSDEYIFSRHALVWGWATWRRAWALNDFELKDWPELRRTSWLLDACGRNADAERFWRRTFDDVHSGINDTWDHQWTYSIWSNKGLSITPGRNLVANIGFHEAATHTPDQPRWYSKVVHGSLDFPLRHPTSMCSNPKLDQWIDVVVYGTNSAWHRAGRFIARLAGRLGMEASLRNSYRHVSRAVRRLRASG